MSEKPRSNEPEIINKNGKTAEGYVEDILSAVKDDQQRDVENKIKIPTEKKETNMESPIIIKGKQQLSPSGSLEQQPSGLFVPEDISLEKQKRIEDEKKQEVKARSKIEKAFGGTIDVINNYPENLNSSIDVGSFIKPELSEKSSEALKKQDVPKEPDKPSGPSPEGIGPRSPESVAVKPEVVEKSKEQSRADLKDVPGRSPEEIAKDYEAITGKKLKEERDRIVKEYVEQRGSRVLKASEAEPMVYAREHKRVEQEDRGEALRRRWAGLTAEQKKQYEINGKLDLVRINKDFSQYSQTKAKEFGVSENAVHRAMNTGLDLDSLENGNIFGFGKKMKIQLASGGEMRFSNPEEFKSWAEGLGNSIDANGKVIDIEAKLRTDKKIIEGRKKLLIERDLCAKQLIKEALGDVKIIEKEKKPEPTEPKPDKPKGPKPENPSGATVAEKNDAKTPERKDIAMELAEKLGIDVKKEGWQTEFNKKIQELIDSATSKEKKEVTEQSEKNVSSVVAEIEKKDQRDPVINSKWMDSAKKYLKKTVGFGLKLLGLCLMVVSGTIHYSAEIAIWALQKRKLNFGEGVKKGKWAVEKVFGGDKKEKEKEKKAEESLIKKLLKGKGLQKADFGVLQKIFNEEDLEVGSLESVGKILNALKEEEQEGSKYFKKVEKAYNDLSGKEPEKKVSKEETK